MATTTTGTRRIDHLHPHPLNHKLYNDTADEELVASVKEKGILEPLLVTKDGTVISGHRRLAAAKKLGLKKVPVVVTSETDKTVLEQMLIDSNLQRPKTFEQIGREFAKRMELEKKLAGKRQKEAGSEGAKGGRGKKTLGAKRDQGFRAPRAEVLAARPFKMSPGKLKRLATVVGDIASLEADGKVKKAEEYRSMVNAGRINAAYRLLHPKPGTGKPKAGKQSKAARVRKVPTAVWKGASPDEALETLVGAMQGAHAYFGAKKEGKDDNLLKSINAALQFLKLEQERRAMDTAGAGEPADN